MASIKQILIITDNPFIAKRFEEEVWCLVDSNRYNLSFKCSPYSNTKNFDLLNPISKIDLKNTIALKTILDKDLILSIHCKQLFPKKLLNKVRCVNVHPGYNPINRGWYPQVFAIINGLEIGATIHEIDEKLDHGKIIARDKVKKFEYDTSLTLYNRVVNKEIELLKLHINAILKNNYNAIQPESEGELHLKKDFNNLCELSLDEKLTMRQAIDILRALTHGDYKNAYYYDQSGKKIFISVNIEHE